MRILLLVFVVVLGAGLVLSTGACGSGDGTTTLPVGPPLFSGTYFFSLFFLSDGAPDDGRAFWGTASSDGAANWTPTVGQNENGVITAPMTVPLPYQYTIAADRTWTWQQFGTDVARGGITADGRVINAATIAPGSTPGIMMMIRREGSFGLASLNGVYHVCALLYDFGPPHLEAWWGTATFNGAGGATFSFVANEDGTITPPAGGPTAYTVAADGTMTINAPPGAVYEGGILLGGDLAIVSGSTTATRDPGVLIFIRQGSDLGTGSAVGNYFLAGASRDGGGGFESVTGPATFDGGGNVVVNFTRNDDGTVAADPPMAATYVIAPNGTVTVNAGGDSFAGAISPDSRFMMISGETSGSGNPQINFLLK